MKNAILGLTFLIYPVLVYFGLQYVKPSYLAAFFALIFAYRYFSQDKRKGKIPHLNILFISVTSLLAFSMLANSAIALKFYPVVVNVSFLVIFAYSLWKPPSVVEVIASLQEELDQQGIIYTRNVTKVWCVFFSVNAMIATWTIFQEDQSYWLIYNGLVSYVLMGLLMLIEFGVRKYVKHNKSKVASS
ncbi:hypothetical protein [Litorilituus lipolyticus]|uniref:DNA gyrase subunit B n=1 Tax=Litorilituus lipolyticus TaxID=2491017 RepID=A0A502KRJ7_9GAMM|nr:hypothetical protein [Litorilituus lipolyticus]TPH12233.1 hypothetical protein EPA86_17985 [Litorilituus lipolyticus]